MPSSTFTFVDQFKEDLLKEVHDFENDTFIVALVASANAPDTSDAVLADLTEIAYTNLSSRTLTGVSGEQTSGTAPLLMDDLVLTASGGSVAAFRYIVIYNDTSTSPADPLVGFWDYGTDLTLADGQSLTIDVGVNGMGTIS